MLADLVRRRLSKTARWGMTLVLPWAILSAPGCDESSGERGGRSGDGNGGNDATGGSDGGRSGGDSRGGSSGMETGGTATSGGTGASSDGGESGTDGTSGVGAVGGAGGAGMNGGEGNLGGEPGGGAPATGGGAAIGGVAGSTSFGGGAGSSGGVVSGGNAGSSAGAGSGGVAGSNAGTSSGGDAGSSAGAASGGNAGSSSGAGSGGDAGSSAGTSAAGGAGAGSGGASGSNGGGAAGMGVCVPNARVCVGELLTQCNADGSAYLPDPVDCAATSTFCCEGACRSPTTYTISANVTPSSSVVNDDGTRMNVFRVSNSDAYLMGIGQSLRTTRAMTLGWYVFEALNDSTGFISVFSRETLSSTTTTSQTSGPMCVKLLYQRYYAIGIAWQSQPVTVYFYNTTFPNPGALGPVVESVIFDGFPAATPSWNHPPAGSLFGQYLTLAR